MYNYNDLKNKVAIVSGAAGLLGSEFSKSLLQQGAIVIGLDYDKKGLSKLNNEMNKKFNKLNFFTYNCDLTNEKKMKLIIKKIIIKFKKIDILINNAGSKSSNLNDFFEKFENYKMKTWKEVMDVNLNSVFLLSQIVSKHMIKKKSGSIIQIGSIQGILGNDKRIYKGSKLFGREISSPAVYSASKSAVIGFSKYLATYLAKYGIRVNAISPGGVFNNHNKTFLKNYSNKVPMNRMGKKNEIASTILFLSSEESSYITGQNIIVDGGYSAW
jgi:NAD(P)-dependent dehydrogenase (short-subunit alcohol dehydrogenase family)